MAVAITQENFQKEIEQATLPIVLDVYATWCGPCIQMTPIFEELEKEFAGQCKFAKLNVDEAREISIKFGVSSVPTFIFIKNNKIKSKTTGYTAREDLKVMINDLLS